jgi:hypothetical protein
MERYWAVKKAPIPAGQGGNAPSTSRRKINTCGAFRATNSKGLRQAGLASCDGSVAAHPGTHIIAIPTSLGPGSQRSEARAVLRRRVRKATNQSRDYAHDIAASRLMPFAGGKARSDAGRPHTWQTSKAASASSIDRAKWQSSWTAGDLSRPQSRIPWR